MVVASAPLGHLTSTPVFGRNAQRAVIRNGVTNGSIDPIAKSLERVPNWRSRSKAFTVAASV